MLAAATCPEKYEGGPVTAAMRFDRMNHRQGSGGGEVTSAVGMYGGGVVRGGGGGGRGGGVSGDEVDRVVVRPAGDSSRWQSPVR